MQFVQIVYGRDYVTFHTKENASLEGKQHKDEEWKLDKIRI